MSRDRALGARKSFMELLTKTRESDFDLEHETLSRLGYSKILITSPALKLL
jgi:hypothetical protein